MRIEAGCLDFKRFNSSDIGECFAELAVILFSLFYLRVILSSSFRQRHTHTDQQITILIALTYSTFRTLEGKVIDFNMGALSYSSLWYHSICSVLLLSCS